MSKTIEERVVEMRFNNKDFERNTATTMSTLDKLKQKLNLTGATKGLTDINAAAKNFDMSGMDTAVSSVQAKFSSLQVVAITAISNITNSAVNAGKRIVSALTIDPIKTGFQEYETQINAVQTILANTQHEGTNLQQVNRALDELNTYADKTIYNFTEMTRNIGTFTAAGVDLNTSVESIKGIANLAAISGSTSQQASTAMYQLSQALAAGKVSLMDWNSVVNAGMGGKVFQDALIRTSELLGTGAKQAVKTYGSFRESLTEGEWLTTKVLTETLKQFSGAYDEADLIQQGFTKSQAKEIMQMAKTAEEAATQVKTFSQLWDTLKESAQSGWTQSWEILIGDFGEAKELLTEISNSIGGVIGKSAELRNKLLGEGLSSGWKQLLDSGIADEAGYIDSIQEVARKNGDAFDKMVADSDDFSDALKKGLKDGTISSKTLSDAVHNLKEKMSGMSEEELKAAGYTSDMVDQIKKLDSGLKDGSVSMDEFVDKILRPSGRENIIQALWNSCKALMSIVNPIKDAFRDIFPAMTGEQLYNITVRLKEFTENLGLSKEQSEKLKTTFKGLFSILDIGKQAITAVLEPLVNFLTGSGVSSIGDAILSITAAFGTFFIKLNEGIKAGKVFSVIGDGISLVLDGISGAISSVMGGVSDLGDFFGRLGEIVSNVFSKISGALSSAVNWIRENISIGDIFAGLAGGGIFLVAKKISGLAGKLGDVVGKIRDIIGGITGESSTKFRDILESINGSLQAFTEGIKVASFVGIAVAITLLTSALEKLSKIDATDIAKGLIAIRLMIAALNSGFIRLSKTLVQFQAKGAIRGAIAMMAVAKAVDILASAMVKLDGLSWKDIAKGLVTIGTSIFALSKAISIIGKNGNITLRTSISIIALAKACEMLAGSLVKFGGMSWKEIARGLTAMGGALAEFTGVLSILSKVGGGKAILGGIAVLIASKSLDELSENLKRLGDMSWGDIARGLTAMGGALTELGVVTGVLGRLSGISGIAGAASLVIAVDSLDEISENLKRIGSMDWDQIGKGLTGMGGALAEVSVVSGVLGKLAGISGLLGSGSIVLAVKSLDEIAASLKNIGSLVWGEIARGLSGMGGALAELGIVSGLLGKLGGLSGLIGAGSIVLGVQGLDKLANALIKFGDMEWGEVARGLVGMGGALTELAVVSGLLGRLAGLSGLIGSGTILLGVQGLGKLADALVKFGTMSWGEIGRGLVAMGGALVELGVVSGALGYLTNIAGLVGAGTITLAAQGLGQIADALIKFGSMEWDEIGRGLAAMGGALGEVALGGLLNTLSGLGALSISAIVQPLDELADALRNFGTIDFETVSNGLTAMNSAFGSLALGGLANTFSILGSLSIATVAEPLGALADSVKKWVGVTIPEGLTENLAALADALLEFTFSGFGASALAESAPAVGQMADSVRKWAGVIVPPTLQANLTSLANGIKAFTFAFVGGWSLSTITEPLGQLADSVKKWSGVVVSEQLEPGLKSLANGIKAFSFAFAGGWSISAIDGPLGKLADSVKKWAGVTVPEGLEDSLKRVANGVKEFSLLDSLKVQAIAEPLNTLSNAFKKFANINVSNGDSLVTFAKNINSCASKLSSIDTYGVSTAVSSINKIINAIKSVNNTNVSNVGKFVKAANSLNNIKVSDISVDTKGLSSAVASVKNTMSSINKTISSNKSSISNAMKTAFSGATKAIKSYKNQINSAAKSLVDGLEKTVKGRRSGVTSAFKTLASGAAGAIRSNYSQFTSSGKYLGSGLVEGIKSKYQAAYNAGYTLGQKAAQGEKDGQKSNSPSKLTIQNGKWLGEGLIIGIKKMGSAVYGAGHDMGNTATSSISDSVSKITRMVENGIDARPTIRPVLDLSDVSKGTSTLNGMLDMTPSIGVMANVKSISSSMNRNQNGVNDDVVYAINKLRKDLSGIDRSSYVIEGITYDDGSNVADAIKTLVRAAKMERRV